MSTSATFQPVPVSQAATKRPSTAEQAAPGSLAWRPFVAGVVGLVSFGIIPAFAWPGKFFTFAAEDFTRLSSVGEWLIALDDSPRARRSIRDALSRVRPSPFLAWLPRFFAAFAASLLAMGIVLHRLTPTELLDGTYWFQKHLSVYPGAYFTLQHADAYQAMVHQLWCGSLLAAYIVHLVHVRLYQNGVRRFVREFNRVAQKRSVLPVRVRMGPSIGAVTVLGSIAFGMSGAWWGIPMLLAASAQSRYTLVTSGALAVQFADRTSRTAARRATERRCAAARCRALLPLPAKFCPQCGAPVPDAMMDLQG